MLLYIVDCGRKELFENKEKKNNTIMYNGIYRVKKEKGRKKTRTHPSNPV